MIDQNLLKELSEKFFKDLSGDLKLEPMKNDVSKTFKLAVEQALEKLDLVTREQFDIQSDLLNETKEKLASLNNRIESLEKNLNKD